MAHLDQKPGLNCVLLVGFNHEAEGEVLFELAHAVMELRDGRADALRIPDLCKPVAGHFSREVCLDYAKVLLEVRDALEVVLSPDLGGFIQLLVCQLQRIVQALLGRSVVFVAVYFSDCRGGKP